MIAAMNYPRERLTWREALRLARYRAAHREVIVGYFGFGAWQARTPLPDGEQVITRDSFRELMDRLDELDGEAEDTG